MTSKISIDNRELLQKISTGEAAAGTDFGNAIVRELAAFRLAAMDSESECLPLDYLQGHKDGLEWAAQLAEANHPETGDWLYDDPIELAEAIRKGPDMPPAQPVADSEPVIVVGDDGGDALSYRRLIQSFEPGTKLYRHAQQPVVPDDVLVALQKVARIRLDLNDFDGDRRGIADCLGDAEEALIEVVNRRAAMLQELKKIAGAANNCRSNKNVQDLQGESRCGIKSSPPLDFLPKNTESRCSNSPVIPEGYVMVPKEPTAEMIAAAMNCDDVEFNSDETFCVNFDNIYAAMVEAAPQPQNAPQNIPEIIPGWIPVSERMPETDGNYWGWWSESKRQGPVWFIKSETQAQFQSYEITHWMPLPAAPQEVPDGK